MGIAKLVDIFSVVQRLIGFGQQVDDFAKYFHGVLSDLKGLGILEVVRNIIQIRLFGGTDC